MIRFVSFILFFWRASCSAPATSAVAWGELFSGRFFFVTKNVIFVLVFTCCCGLSWFILVDYYFGRFCSGQLGYFWTFWLFSWSFWFVCVCFEGHRGLTAATAAFTPVLINGISRRHASVSSADAGDTY